MVRPALLLCGLAATLGAAPAYATPDCSDILPPSQGSDASAAEARRALVPEDLVTLRDIGPANLSEGGPPLLTRSPDGRRAAFQIRRADVGANGYCLAMVVVTLDGSTPPRVVDLATELVRSRYDYRGKADVATGIAEDITPRWSPDGRWLAFLRQQGDVTQIWRAWTDGSGSEALTSGPDDINDFRIAPDGRTIVYASRPGVGRARAAIAAEATRGFHYDDRYAPMISARPLPATPIATETFELDVGTRATRTASGAEASLLEAAEARTASWPAPGGGSRRAEIRLPQRLLAREGQLVARLEDGTEIACADPACAQAGQPWWTADGRAIRYLRREGWANESSAIYEWTPGDGAPRRIYLTDDILADCSALGAEILCLREGSLQPRRLERLDPASGARQVMFDPNPQWARLTLGAVERLHLTNAQGLPSIADLVLPVGHRPGIRVPLVIVQYSTRGFLRGGVGDEYPIQAFANRGYAVLSTSRPTHIYRLAGARDRAEASRAELAGFAGRRNKLSSVETGVHLAIERGIADPTRIGITGMSDGASIATFGLIHSELFAAAALSNCCIDSILATRVGPAAAREFHAGGYPRLTDEADDFWRMISLRPNARRIRTPILLQVPDEELMSTLESFTALREVGAPADMYVFPGEYHVKWRPAHRLAIYERSLDWFDYWMLGRRSEDPERQAELSHWDGLRAERDRLAGRQFLPGARPNDRARPRCRAGRAGARAPHLSFDGPQ